MPYPLLLHMPHVPPETGQCSSDPAVESALSLPVQMLANWMPDAKMRNAMKTRRTMIEIATRIVAKHRRDVAAGCQQQAAAVPTGMFINVGACSA